MHKHGSRSKGKTSSVNLKTWQVSILLALLAAFVCIAAQSIILVQLGLPITIFPGATVKDRLYSLAEFFGFVSGVVGVYLMVKQSVWNYPVGLIWAVAYGIYFFSVAQHFGEATLMLINAIYLVDGWIKWMRKAEQPELPVTRLTPYNWGVIGASLLLLVPLIIYLLKTARGSYVYWDGVTTAFALTAQYLTNRKVFESWYFWIAANVVIIPVFIYRQYYPTAILYTIFTVMAVIGIKEWRQSMSSQTPLSP